MLAAERSPSKPSGLSPEDERALIRQSAEDHYRHILDQPLPALGGKSPRTAAKTPKGREKVVAWLKTLENHSAKRPAGDPIGEYDFGWMWRKLDVEALRQWGPDAKSTRRSPAARRGHVRYKTGQPRVLQADGL